MSENNIFDKDTDNLNDSSLDTSAEKSADKFDENQGDDLETGKGDATFEPVAANNETRTAIAFGTKFDWDNEPNRKKEKKTKSRTVTMRFFAAMLVLAMVLCSTIAYRISESSFEKKLNEAKKDMNNNSASSMSEIGRYAHILDQFFSSFEYHEYDRDTAIATMLKAYAASTGDKYATYYTAEEYAKMQGEDAGELVGIGVSVTENKEYGLIEILSVYKDSPAEDGGVLPGDLISSIKVNGEILDVTELGFDPAVALIRGEVGTFAEFTVKRGNNYEETVDFKIERKKITTYSVLHHVCTTDASIGIIKVVEFNFTTPPQFKEAVEDLKSQGCTQFVIDVRYNPGGALISVEAVLSYFLNKGDNIVYTENSLKNGEWSVAQAVAYGKEPYNYCDVKDEEIGMYRDLDVIVLVNGNTASAGELFTATLKEYGLAKVVGVKTYGKGSMQTTYSLEPYGLDGAVKMTTHLYSPMSKQNYDGVGIYPDVEINLDEALTNKNIYKITDEEDNQLQAAIAELKK